MNTSIVKYIALAFVSCGTLGATAAEGPSEQVAEQRVARSEYRQTLDAIMHEEGRDAAWADGIESKLKNSLNTIGTMDLAIVQLTCAKTLCRVVLDHKSLDGQQDVLAEIAGAPGFDLAGKAHLEISDNGTARSHVYLLRSDDVAWPLTPDVMR